MPDLDIEDRVALTGYLRAEGRIGADETPDVQVLHGGVSNRTVRVRRSSGEGWVLKQALRKLRVQVEWLSDPQRIEREALGMRRLGELLPDGTVPRLIFEDAKHHLLAMSAVPEPHFNWKSRLLEGMLDLAHVRQFAGLLASMHGNSRGRPDAEAAFRDTSFFESLRLEPYYEYTAGRTPRAAEFLSRLLDETRRTKECIVHGDFSPKNILIHNERLILLDHEVIHFGDPAFDLGFSMTHLLSKAHHLSARRSDFGRAAELYWMEYCSAIPDGRRHDLLEERAVRHTLACLLARVDGRSPLEYLTEAERTSQRDAVLEMMSSPPCKVRTLIQEFLAKLP